MLRSKGVMEKGLLLLLCVPLFTNIFLENKVFSALENRVLTQKIPLSSELLSSGVLSERVEAFVQDQFPFREFFINIKSDGETLLQKGENNGVYLGRDGYLFIKGTVYDEKILQENLEAIKVFEESLRDKLSILLVPPSSLVLQDKLPTYYVPVLQKDQYDHVLSALKDTGMINLEEVLTGENQQPTYFKTDHHWTQWGAYLGYEALMHSMGKKPVDIKDYVVDKVEDFKGSFYAKYRGHLLAGEPFVYYEKHLAQLKVELVSENILQRSVFFKEHFKERDKYAAYLNGNFPLITLKNPEALYKEKVLVLKDSQANAMAPFLADTFQEVHYMDLRYYNLSLKAYMEEEGFDQVILLYGLDSVGEESSLGKLKY